MLLFSFFNLVVFWGFFFPFKSGFFLAFSWTENQYLWYVTVGCLSVGFYMPSSFTAGPKSYSTFESPCRNELFLAQMIIDKQRYLVLPGNQICHNRFLLGINNLQQFFMYFSVWNYKLNYRSFSLSLSLYIYIYIYIQRERERDWKTKKSQGKIYCEGKSTFNVSV